MFYLLERNRHQNYRCFRSTSIKPADGLAGKSAALPTRVNQTGFHALYGSGHFWTRDNMVSLARPHTCQSRMDSEPFESGSIALNQNSAMNGFLRAVERHALRIAELATGNREDALEIVQETMLGRVKRYGARPSAEWAPLFYRIL
jgi:hypothetical protein